MFNKSEVATILAALRFYQEHGQGDPANRSLDIHEIATLSGDVISLDDEAIDQLCEKINCSKEKLMKERHILVTVQVDCEDEAVADKAALEAVQSAVEHFESAGFGDVTWDDAVGVADVELVDLKKLAPPPPGHGVTIQQRSDGYIVINEDDYVLDSTIRSRKDAIAEAWRRIEEL